MKVAVLTSSRADYSIYFPLLKKLQSDTFFSLSIIAFGTHLSERHGHTIDIIREDGFAIAWALNTAPAGDQPESISLSMARTMAVFTDVWRQSDYDVVICLGDRYEMFAACASGMPFNVRFAHVHGGEETRGAIDDAFRHSITHMSAIHFAAAEEYRQRIIALKGSDGHVYNTGSLSIDNLKNLKLLNVEEFRDRFHIDLSLPSILITFHPETVSFEKNEMYVNELIAALAATEGYQFIITMPNADTMGNLIRDRLNEFIAKDPRAVSVESFGTLGYLSCMKHCSFMLGNTSSGFIEASFFPKFVINMGDRQQGRIVTKNIRNCEIRKKAILDAVEEFQRDGNMSPIQIYGDGHAAGKIVDILKEMRYD